ncbi:unnamed protein product [Rhizophagus irregularis]|nr:unnamed protein product [Rhizophagus irregularis]
MHPSRRERTTQLIEKECNRQFIEDKCEGVEDERVNICSKREKGGMKNPQLWKQDHLTFQVNLREVRDRKRFD